MTTCQRIVEHIAVTLSIESDREDLVEMVNRIAVDAEDETGAPPSGVQMGREEEGKYKESELPPHHCKRERDQ